jgi:hypothetical protein
MSELTDLMLQTLGPPDPAEPVVWHFENEIAQMKWDMRTEDNWPAGWFRDGFLHLLGSGLDKLKPCLEAWSWMIPPNDDRTILGHNAYGAIAFCDGMNEATSDAQIIDPVTLRLYSGMDFIGFFGRWIVHKDIKSFHDDSVYKAYRATGKPRLKPGTALGIKAALPMGGKMELSNFETVGIVDYYEATAPVYAKAQKEHSKPKAAPAKKGTRSKR